MQPIFKEKQRTDFFMYVLLVELLSYSIKNKEFSTRDFLDYLKDLGFDVHLRSGQRLIKRLTDIGILKKIHCSRNTVIPACKYSIIKPLGEIELDKIESVLHIKNMNIFIYTIKDSIEKNNGKISSKFLIKLYLEFDIELHIRKAQRILVSLKKIGVIKHDTNSKLPKRECLFIFDTDFIERAMPVLSIV